METTIAFSFRVTPLVGVWIEIGICSLVFVLIPVTPLVGVWIEINCLEELLALQTVTPLVGVWIEITLEIHDTKLGAWSLPLWECGLKFCYI